MNVPKYIQQMMERSEFALGPVHPDAAPGYTIWVYKRTDYTCADTLREECERLVGWAKRNYAEAEILSCPESTRHRRQRALVTVYDPCMKYMEKYIPEKINWRVKR